MSCFNDLILYTGFLQGGCQGWTPLARGPFGGGGLGLPHPLMNIYRCRSQPEVGAGDRSGGLTKKKEEKKNTREVILQGYIQAPSINGCLKMAVGGRGRRYWYLEVAGGGGSGLGGGGAALLDIGVTRLSGPWEQRKSPATCQRIPMATASAGCMLNPAGRTTGAHESRAASGCSTHARASPIRHIPKPLQARISRTRPATWRRRRCS